MILDKPVDKPAAIVTLSTVADGRRPRAAGDRPVKVPGQQVSEVPAEPRRWPGDQSNGGVQGIARETIAAPTADEAKEKPTARGRADGEGVVF